MISFNCQTGNHGGCNQFHLGCRCDHHPRGKHLTPKGRFSFVDVDTYPNESLEQLLRHRFAGLEDVDRNVWLSVAQIKSNRGRHERL